MKVTKVFQGSLEFIPNFEGHLFLILEGVKNCWGIRSWISDVVGGYRDFKDVLGKNLAKIGWSGKVFDTKASFMNVFQNGENLVIYLKVYFDFPDSPLLPAGAEARVQPIVEDIFNRFCSCARISFTCIEERLKKAQAPKAAT